MESAGREPGLGKTAAGPPVGEVRETPIGNQGKPRWTGWSHDVCWKGARRRKATRVYVAQESHLLLTDLSERPPGIRFNYGPGERGMDIVEERLLDGSVRNCDANPR
ncbi:MAG: hypothetical protein ACYTFG_22395 [Planctomycetota bacterium]|jgi:hypothetical protein